MKECGGDLWKVASKMGGMASALSLEVTGAFIYLTAIAMRLPTIQS
jgi:hypothetical protein